MSYYFLMKQLHKVSLQDITDKGFWSLSHRSKKAVFTNAVLPALEPLTLHRAALVPQRLPNPALCFSQFSKQICRTETVFMSSSPKNKTKIKCQPTDRSETTAAQYCGVRVVDDYTVSPPGDTVHVCGIWINK